MNPDNNITDIVAILNQMLQELSQEELSIVSQYVQNEYGEDNIDSEGNYPNLFRDFICDPIQTMEEYFHWNPPDEE